MAKDAITRVYELTYLLPVGYTDSELSKLKAAVEAVLAKYKATISTTEDWGKKKLAYAIKHANKFHTEAVYVHHVFSADPSQVQAVEREMFLQPQVIRHLLVISEPVKAPKKAKTVAAPVVVTTEETSE
jgi:small subunit ribosomal protein S6